MPNPDNPKTWTPDYAWKLIDQVLLMAKVSEIAREMQEKLRKAKATAYYEGRKRGNAAFYPHERIRNEEAGADEWAEKLYQAALEVWQTQGYKPSRPFFQAVYRHLLVNLFAARKGAVTGDMTLTDKRTGRVGHSVAALQEFARAMKRLQSRWNTKMEVAAKEQEYAEQRERKAEAEAQTKKANPKPVTETSITAGTIEIPGLTIYGIHPDSTAYLAQDRATGHYVMRPTRDSAVFDDRLIPIGSVQELMRKPKTPIKIEEPPIREIAPKQATADDPRNWSPLRQRVEAFRQIKQLVTGPRERIPESLVREALAEQYGITPEEVTRKQIQLGVSSLLTAYPAITVVLSATEADANEADDQEESPHKKRPGRQLTREQVRRRQVIFGALQMGLIGPEYCRALDQRKLATPETWQTQGCPVRYAEAYKDTLFRQRIHYEKSNFTKTFNALSPAKRDQIIAGVTRSTRK